MSYSTSKNALACPVYVLTCHTHSGDRDILDTPHTLRILYFILIFKLDIDMDKNPECKFKK